MSDPILNDDAAGAILEIADATLEFSAIPAADTTPTARQVLAYRGLSPHNDYCVIQWLRSGDLEEIRLEEQVRLEGDTSPRLIVVKSDRLFRLVLDERSLVWPIDRISESALRKLGEIGVDEEVKLARDDKPDKVIKEGETVRLGPDGTEVFYSRPLVWKLNVQGVIVESNSPTIIAREAIREAGLDADASWIIVLKTKSERKQIEIDDEIDLRLPGIEKLRLTPREINNGEISSPPQREFALLEIDEKGLANRGITWRTLVDSGRRWLLLDSFPLPEGYTVTDTTIAIEVPTSYNAAELDMFYCHPPLALKAGGVIPQTQSSMTISGQRFQRWSRHRGPSSRWRSGRDNVLSHLALIDEALQREIKT